MINTDSRTDVNHPPDRLTLIEVIIRNPQAFGPPTHALAACLLIVDADDSLEATTSLDTICATLGISKRAATRILRTLVDKGLIQRRQARPGTPTTTSIRASTLVAEVEVLLARRKVDSGVRKVDSPVHPRGTEESTVDSGVHPERTQESTWDSGVHPKRDQKTAFKRDSKHLSIMESLYKGNKDSSPITNLSSRGEGVWGRGDPKVDSRVPLADPLGVRPDWEHAPLRWKGNELILVNGTRQAYVDQLKGLDITIDEILEQAAVSFIDGAGVGPLLEGEGLLRRFNKYFTACKLSARREARKDRRRRTERPDTGSPDTSKIQITDPSIYGPENPDNC